MTRILSILPIAAAVLILTSATSALGGTIYVDADATGAENGASWENAYVFLRDALVDAYSAGEASEILVAEGLYTPDKSSAVPAGNGDRNDTFLLISGVALRGGYAGFGQPDPDERDIKAYQTILSGDLAGNDIHIGDVTALSEHDSQSENSYHVLIAGLVEPNAVLEGFTVTGGNANGAGVDSYGGGMLIAEGNPVIANCTFLENSASSSGGAIYNGASSDLHYNAPTIIDCLFQRNYAVSSGGAISNYQSAPKIIACTFTENRSHAGAAIVYDRSTTEAPTELKYCTFVQNMADSFGGAVYNTNGSPIVTNCLFEANVVLDSAKGVGGAFANVKSTMTLKNCTIVGNLAPRGGSVIQNSESSVIVRNCIIWGNPDGHHDIATTGDEASYIEMDYSCIQNGWVGWGNIDEDPLFAQDGIWDPNGTPSDETDDFWVRGDYHLKSRAGRWDSSIRGWVSDDATSPCIDNGDYGEWIGNELLPNGWLVNMGVFGGTSQASMSLCPSGHPADCYTDGVVNMVDLLMLSLRWLAEGLFIPEDLDRDGIVDLVDLAIMSSQWKNVNTTPCSISLLDDGFENGEWNDLWTQGSQNKWHISSNNVADANFSGEVEGQAEDATLTSIPMDLEDMSVAFIGFFWHISESFDVGEYLAFDVSTDGGAIWQEMARLDGDGGFEGVWRIVSVKLRDIRTLQIRFRATASDSSGKAHIDLVQVDAAYH